MNTEKRGRGGEGRGEREMKGKPLLHLLHVRLHSLIPPRQPPSLPRSLPLLLTEPEELPLAAGLVDAAAADVANPFNHIVIAVVQLRLEHL